MKPCPFCRESIHDDAIKCRFCQSMLIPLQPAAPTASEEKKEGDERVTYVIDNDIVRFAKFALATLAVFVAVGAYFYGIDLKQAAKEVKDIAEQAKTDMQSLKEMRDEVNKTVPEVRKVNDETKALSETVHAQISSITADADKMHGIVENSQAELAARVKETVDATLEKELANVLTPAQLSAYKTTKATTETSKYTRDQIQQLVTRDLDTTATFFRKYGFPITRIPMSIDKDNDYLNTYWDGRRVVFGMGMVNSDLFGPYDSSLVEHEATHKLFNLPFEGESGAITESICDVVAVLISGNNWTVGRVRGKQPMVLRSLARPGSAYDSPALGKDMQGDHMSGYIKTTDDNGGVHYNCGILNKAAYLMSEGGSHHGINVTQGFGREKLALLYMTTIKSLPTSAMTFKDFRGALLQSAQKLSFSPVDLETVKQSFSAVGI